MNRKLISHLNQYAIQYHRIIQLFSGVIAILASLYYLLQNQGFPVRYISVTTIHKIILPAVEIFLVAFFYPRFLRANNTKEAKLSVILLYLISNAVFLQPILDYYFRSEIISQPNIRRIIPFALIYYYLLLGSASVLMVYLAHWRITLYQSTHPKIFEPIQKLLEQTFAPSKRPIVDVKQPQDNKLLITIASLSKIPILGTLLNGIVRFGIGHSALLLIFVMLGFGLRLWGLDQLPPYIDEFTHLNAAKQLFLGTPLNEIAYQRSLYIVTLPIYLSFMKFGISLWAARFAGVIFNMLAIIPLFLIAKRMNKHIALIAIGLYATNPWMISIARNVREYAYFPFYFYLVSLLILNLIENLPSNFIIIKDYKYFFSRKRVFAILLLLFPLYRITFIPQKSTLPIIGLMYIVFGLIFLSRLSYKDQSNKIILMVSGFIIAAIVMFSRLKFSIASSGSLPKFNDYFLLLLFNNPEQQWYYDRLPFFGIILSIMVIFSSFIYAKLNSAISFIIMNFVIYLGFFTIVFNRYTKPRYGSFIEIWYILIMAVGLYLAYRFIDNKLNKKYSFAVVVMLFLAFFNWNQVVLPSVYAQSGPHPITNEYHYETNPVEELLVEKKKDGDILISTFSNDYLSFSTPFTFDSTFYYVYYESASAKSIYYTIAEYPNGWIILDVKRGLEWSQPLTLEDFIHAHKSVEYLGLFGDYLVFRWGAD